MKLPSIETRSLLWEARVLVNSTDLELLNHCGNYRYHLLQQSNTVHFILRVCIYVFRMVLRIKSDYFPKQY
jgi:hypothetical protein